MSQPHICPVCEQEKPKLMHRRTCADCYRVAHRAASIRNYHKKREGFVPPPKGKTWDSTKANELLMRKL